MSELLDFKWPVHKAGYAIKRGWLGKGKSASEIIVGSQSSHDRLSIVPNGVAIDEREPLKIGKSVFRNFVDWEASAVGALDFTESFGFLTKAHYQLDPPRMSVDEWLSRQAGLKSAVQKWEAGDLSGLVEQFNTSDLGVLSTKLRLNRTGTSVLLGLRPQSLWSLMLVEFALHVTNDTGLKQCEWCGTWFPFGTGSGRRSKARFCSDPCRKRSHIQSKKGDEK
jgi:hypothetical protein